MLTMRNELHGLHGNDYAKDLHGLHADYTKDLHGLHADYTKDLHGNIFYDYTKDLHGK